MKKIKEFFERIKRYLFNIINKENIKLLENKQTDEQPNKKLYEEMVDKKEEFFELYNHVKSDEIDLEDLCITDLIDILTFSKEELNLKDKMIDSINNKVS